jgi:hypothetical protein
LIEHSAAARLDLGILIQSVPILDHLSDMLIEVTIGAVALLDRLFDHRTGEGAITGAIAKLPHHR